jgi:uncharacterized metal-binding protein YceD (DUF177 family)
MKRLAEFSLPIQGLTVGFYVYEFQIDAEFFSHFDASPVKIGDVQVQMNLDRLTDMLVFDFEISGIVRTECDRCLAEIDLPIESEEQLIVKFSEEWATKTDDDLTYIHPEASEFNVAEYIYEYIILAMPMMRVLEDCEEELPPPCDFEMLKRIQKSEETPMDNPFRDILGNFQEN